MLEKLRGKTGRLLTALSLCLTLALVLEMAPVHAETFDQKVAKNGTGFVKLSDAEKTDFLLFGSKATKADGMQGRWKMLTKAQVQSVYNNTTTEKVFGVYTWKSGQSYSTTSDGKNLVIEDNVAGIPLKELATGYGIAYEDDTKTKITAIDKTGAKESTANRIFEDKRYFYSGMGAAGVEIDPMLKVDSGKLSLRIGQSKPTEITASKWKNDLKSLQIDTVTTATQRPDVVFDVVADKKTREYVLSDIVGAGQYKAIFAYYDAANRQTTVQAEGARLSDILSSRSIVLTAGDTVTVVNKQGKRTVLKSAIGNYLLAYKGTVDKAGQASTVLKSDSEFCLLGPGRNESEVLMSSVYSVEINRKAPAKTKITKLTKKKKTITVKWKKVSEANGYEIWMATKKKGKYKKIKTITKVSTVKFTKKKLKKGKKYFFKLRAYKNVSGSKLYGPWSAVKYKKL